MFTLKKKSASAANVILNCQTAMPANKTDPSLLCFSGPIVIMCLHQKRRFLIILIGHSVCTVHHTYLQNTVAQIISSRKSYPTVQCTFSFHWIPPPRGPSVGTARGSMCVVYRHRGCRQRLCWYLPHHDLLGCAVLTKVMWNLLCEWGVRSLVYCGGGNVKERAQTRKVLT